jgi:integrase
MVPVLANEVRELARSGRLLTCGDIGGAEGEAQRLNVSPALGRRGASWSPLKVDRPPAAAPYRRFGVVLPTGERYFTVLGSDDLRVQAADEFLFQHLAQGGAESTTESYAGAIALFLTWCASARVGICDAACNLGRFSLWLRHFNGTDQVLTAGPGARPVRGPSRINTVLAAVREFHKHLVAVKALPMDTLDALYRVVDDRDLPEEVRGEHIGLRFYLRPRHRVPRAENSVTGATEEEVTALMRACRNARDRLIVVLAVRVGMRRGEIAGLRLEDLHLMPGRHAGCQVEGPHLHVIKRTNPNRAAAKSPRSRELPCDPLVVRLFDDWATERDEVPGAADCDFVLVTLTGPRTGRAIRPGLINEVFEALVQRAKLDRAVHPHMLRHSMISNVLDHGGTLDEAQALAGHASLNTTSHYNHPAPSRLRAAVERVPSPRTGRQEPS